MKIISKFRDYYDNIQSYGYDPKVMYFRKPSIVEDINIIREKNLTNFSYGYHYYTIGPPYIKMDCIPIIFCGKLYICFHIDYAIDKKWNISSWKTIGGSSYEYDFDKIMSIVYSNDILKKWIHTSKYVYKLKSILSLNGQPYGSDICAKNNSPIIAYFKHSARNNIWKYTTNICLRDYQFYKVVDPYTAYQEIEMFISSTLTKPDKEPWPISDELKAQSKGFDKYRFRKRPKG